MRSKKSKPICVTEATVFLHTCETQERKKEECLIQCLKQLFSAFEQDILLVPKEAVPKNIPEKINATSFCLKKKTKKTHTQYIDIISI